MMSQFDTGLLFGVLYNIIALDYDKNLFSLETKLFKQVIT